jgi:hypothetical protein
VSASPRVHEDHIHLRHSSNRHRIPPPCPCSPSSPQAQVCMASQATPAYSTPISFPLTCLRLGRLSLVLVCFSLSVHIMSVHTHHLRIVTPPILPCHRMKRLPARPRQRLTLCAACIPTPSPASAPNPTSTTRTPVRSPPRNRNRTARSQRRPTRVYRSTSQSRNPLTGSWVDSTRSFGGTRS